MMNSVVVLFRDFPLLVVLLGYCGGPLLSNALRSSSTDFNTAKIKAAENLKDVIFQSRITVPFGPNPFAELQKIIRILDMVVEWYVVIGKIDGHKPQKKFNGYNII